MKIIKKFRVTNTDFLLAIDTSGLHKTAWCEIVNSSLPNPKVKSVMQGSIRLEFEPKCLNHDVTMIIHFDEEKVKIKNNIFSMKTNDVAKSLGRGVLYAIISATIGYAGNLTYKKLSLDGSSFWKASKKIEYSFKIGSNDKPFYNSVKIKQLEEDHIEAFSLLKSYSIKSLFHYTENGVYIMRDVAKHNDGKTVIVANREQASEYCLEMFDGRILKEQEYNKYILTNIIQSLKSPFKRAKNTTEWTSETHPDDSDFYKILTKNLVVEGENFKKLNGFTYGEEESIGSGYRCAMFDSDWEETKIK